MSDRDRELSQSGRAAAAADPGESGQGITEPDSAHFTARGAWRIFERGTFSIWSVNIVGDPLIAPDGLARHRVVVKGEDMPLTRDDSLFDVVGRWELRKANGTSEYQIQAYAVTPQLPQSEAGMIAFLSSPFIKGCGPATARKIVDAFGQDTWTVLGETPQRLLELKGVGRRQAERIADSYRKNVGYRDTVTALAPYGISPQLAVKIAQNIANAEQVVRENPYALCSEKIGIGFKTADRIAREGGLDPGSPARFAAALDHCLDEAGNDGHCFLTREQLLDQAWTLLDPGNPEAALGAAGRQGLEAELDREIRRGRYAVDVPDGAEGVTTFEPGPGDHIYLWRMWRAEQSAAAHLLALSGGGQVEGVAGGSGGSSSGGSSSGEPLTAQELEAAYGARVDAAAVMLSFKPAAAQREAALRFMVEPVLVLTGIPGSGKTATLRLILATLQQPEHEVLLCAPTGRAARRMSEQTGMPASTIHAALQLDPETNEMPDEPLQKDTVIVDEASMMDIQLFDRLLRRLKPGCRLLLSGDPYQLPSVGPGNVLIDVISSGVIPVVRLTELFRQHKGSVIAANAARIRQGDTDLTYNETCAFVTANNAEDAAAKIHRLYLKAVEYTGDADDVVCLTPLRQRTMTGSNQLNVMLRESLNPVPDDAPSISYGDRRFYTGDRVMLMRNSKLPLYEDSSDTGQVSNGDTGTILSIFVDEDEDQAAVVRFNQEDYLLDQSDFQHMDWAYACTIHKSQGSEYRFAIITLMDLHYIMLRRNLLYTAVTRAKENLIIVGQKSAVNRAIRTEDTHRRQTGLVRRLREVPMAKIQYPEGSGVEQTSSPDTVPGLQDLSDPQVQIDLSDIDLIEL